MRQEIQRFESVHPSIYAIYDLIDAIPDPLIQQQIREHVVCIEGELSNSCTIFLVMQSLVIDLGYPHRLVSNALLTVVICNQCPPTSPPPPPQARGRAWDSRGNERGFDHGYK